MITSSRGDYWLIWTDHHAIFLFLWRTGAGGPLVWHAWRQLRAPLRSGA